jgi:ribosomal-protein-alanine N-acetyltransferase
MVTPTLETERLILRPARASDAELIFKNWTSDPDVSEYLRWNVHKSIDETITWLSFTESNVSDENSYDWLFVLKEINEPVGSGGMFYNDVHSMFEIGYCLMKQYWGFGLATEAAKEFMKFAVTKLNKQSFFACHAKENPISGRVLEKLGFVYSGNGQYASFDGKRVYKSAEYFYQCDTRC